ncbi:AMP-binding protein [Plantactinospora sonchi]|uniref:AMP-binding protein n=1 Tax=Plantactinospora sonchi TaxID=1544735 RepID=A0ABU7RXI9_9ACTN
MIPLPSPGARLVDAATGESLHGPRLDAALDTVVRALDAVPPGVVACLVGNELPSVLRYLGALRARRPVVLWGAGIAAGPVEELAERFAPAAVLGLAAAPAPGRAGPSAAQRPPGAPPGYRTVESEPLGPAWIRRTTPETRPHPDLGLLLGTSGSTGRPRLVRLSTAAVLANADAIVTTLGIGAGDVAITTLPLFYSYGLSVLHSHLRAGATVVLDRRGVLDGGFWDSVDRYGVTSLAGVPHTFELLARKPWTPDRSPRVRTLTTSGGRLSVGLVTRFGAAMAEHDGRLYVMYGQTEAGPRICVLPPERLPEKAGSVGPPIPGVRLDIDPDRAADPTGRTGEVLVHGPGVMMGYAETATDLGRGDDLGGTLRTGDTGQLDDDGYLWLSGRAGRIGKAFGVRVNLDAVEHLVAEITVAAAVPDGDRVLVLCERADRSQLAAVVAAVTQRFGLHRLGVSARAVDGLPRHPNGKVDYRSLTG